MCYNAEENAAFPDGAAEFGRASMTYAITILKLYWPPNRRVKHPISFQWHKKGGTRNDDSSFIVYIVHCLFSSLFTWFIVYLAHCLLESLFIKLIIYFVHCFLDSLFVWFIVYLILIYILMKKIKGKVQYYTLSITDFC